MLLCLLPFVLVGGLGLSAFAATPVCFPRGKCGSTQRKTESVGPFNLGCVVALGGGGCVPGSGGRGATSLARLARALRPPAPGSTPRPPGCALRVEKYLERVNCVEYEKSCLTGPVGVCYGTCAGSSCARSEHLKPNMVVPGAGPVQPEPSLQDAIASNPLAAATCKGIVVFSGKNRSRRQLLRLGVHKSAWVWLPSPGMRVAASVRSRPPMQRTAPAARMGGRQRAKLQPARPVRLGKMLEECDPVAGGPYPAHEGQGRTWSDDCPEQSDGPGSGRP